MIRKSIPLVLAAMLALSACENSEQRAARHFEAGVALLDSGEVSQALLELRNVLRLQNDHAEARTLLARTLRERGDTGGAFREYSRLIDRHPDILEGRVALAEMAFEAGNWDEATRHGRAAQELGPSDPRVVLVATALDYREARLAENFLAADEAARRARTYLQEIDGENLIAWRLVVDQALSGGDPEVALAELDTALEARPDIYEFHGARLQLLVELERTTDIAPALQSMIVQFPEREEPRSLLVSWYINQGDTEAAEAFLRELAEAPEAGVAEKLGVVAFVRQSRGEAAALEELDRLISAGGEAGSNLETLLALRASIQFDRGETETAMAAMEQLLEEAEITESTDNLRVILARMRISTGNPEAARELVEQVLERDGSHVEALKMHSNWLIEADRPDEAIEALRTAQAAAPRDPQLMVLMGQAHDRRGARELAGERYALAVELSGQAAQESLLYARHLMEVGRLDSADATLASAMRVSPQSLPLMRAMAEVQMRQNDWDRATRLIWQMRALDTDAARAAADESEAELLLRQGRTDDTIAFLEGLVSQGAGIGAVAQLARTQVLEGQNEGAQDLIDAQLAANPNDPALRFLRAGLHLLAEEAEEAETIYRSLVTEFPGAEPPLRVLYSLLQSQGRTEEAEEIIGTAVAAAPGAPMPLVLRAAQLEQAGDIDGAIAIYEELYAGDTSNLILANNLASLISAHRDDDESLERASTIAGRLRGTTVPAFQDTYGWIQYRRGNYEEALEYLKPAAAGLPDDPLVHFHLGMTYLALERRTEGRETLERALEIAATANPLPQLEKARDILHTMGSE